MRLLKPALQLVLLQFLLLVTAQQSIAGNFSQYNSGRWVTVAYVYDGDTFKTTHGEKVRLLGINTPEIAHNDNPGEILGPEAGRYLASLIRGKQVKLQFDKERKDNYGRTLAHVYLRDGTWINGRMVETGVAHLYLFAPNFEKAGELLKLEQKARSEKAGIWRTERFRPVSTSEIDKSNIGQFRIVAGKVASLDRDGWGFEMGRISVSIPRQYRQWFKSPLKLSGGTEAKVHGTIRLSRSGNLYLALHSPFDLEIIRP